MTETFFFDTYALIELVKGNPDYVKFKNSGKMTSMMNLLELYYSFLLDFDEKTAEFYFNIFLNFLVPYNENTIKNAAKFRFRNRKSGLSYVDCLGYIIAFENSVKFLTGDKGFKDLENVEFVR